MTTANDPLTDAPKRLCVLYLSPYFWPEEIGSAPYCTDLAVWLRQRGHDVRTVAFRPHYPCADQFAAWADGSRDEEVHEGIPISRVAVGSRGAGSFKDRAKNDLRYLWAVCRRAMGGGFKGTDIVVSYVPSILTLYAARLVWLFTGARIVTVVHDIESGLATSLGLVKGTTLPMVMRLVERVALAQAESVVVLTEGMKNELRAIGCKRPITVLPIWADVVPARPVESNERLTVAYSGNFGKKQNLDQLLPLIERLSRENNPIRVVLRGDGSEKERIRRQVEELGIKNTEFLPLAPAEAFIEALQSTNIHLVPQALNVANYALPSKLFSIMTAGRPYVCIADAASPLDDLARRSGAGLCVRPGDADALYRAVVDLAGDVARQNRMGEAGRRFVDEHMNKNTILKAYEEILLK